MFGLYMLAIYLGIAIIAAGFVALLVVVALAVGLVTHPIRTLALVFHKLAALAAGLALILALIVWFWYDHSKPDFAPCFWGSIGVIVASILIRAFAEWILERPTRAERRAMKRAAAQETGRVTMRMPVSEEVAAAFDEHLLGSSSIPPVMGYVMIVHDCPDSRIVGRGVRSAHFPIDPDFEGASYLDRFLLLCDRLRRKSLYQAVWLVFANPEDGVAYEPSALLSYDKFIANIVMALGVHRA